MIGAMSRNLYIYETEILLLPCECTFVFRNFIVNSLESFPSYLLHTVLKQAITMSFKDQVQFFVFLECADRKYFKILPSLKSAHDRRGNMV